MSVQFLLCFFLVTAVFAKVDENKSKNDELYKQIRDEKEGLMMSISHSMMVQQKHCKSSCDEITSTLRGTKCHCDKQCVDFGDCCLDYWQSCNASFIKAYYKQEIFKCIPPVLRLSVNSTAIINSDMLGYEIVTNCPLTFQNLRIKNACENPEEDNENVLPLVAGNDGRSYKNQFCAECHGISEFQRWNTTLNCENETIKRLVESRIQTKNYKFTTNERKEIRENCVVQMDPPYKVKGTRCNIVSECENKASKDFLKCKLYKQLIFNMFQPTMPTKNPHCARCSGTPLFYFSAMNFFGGTEGKKQSLGILFDFTKSSQIYGLKEITTEEKCNTNEVYDFQLKACRTKRIQKIEEFKNWTCAYANETFPNSSRYITVYRNLSIFVVSHQKIYNEGEYLWHQGNLTVCGNFTVTYFKTSMKKLDELHSDAEFYLTMVGLTLSILALLTVIFTYFLFSELRSKLPGKIVINLSISLMLAQLVFLFDMSQDVNGIACKFIAVILQFLYLAAFCWMNVMAFDVSRTFAGKSHRSHSSSRNKVFILCMFYAWGLPLIITGLTLIIDHTGVMNVAYGNIYYCWITNPVAMVIFFVVPVVLMLLFNIVALVRVLVAVRRVRKVTKKVRDTSTAGQDVRMCWKLTAVFGLTWILCLAAEHHIALRIIFIIFNSLQGVFIMIGFIMTKRVLNMYLKKAGKEPLTISTAVSTQKSTLSRSTVSRKTSSVPLVDRKPVEKSREAPQQAVEAVNDNDSPETQLISSMEGPETKL